eukprot:RCo007417
MIRGIVTGLLLLITLCAGMPFHSAELSGLFHSYKGKFNRAYSSAAEERKRLQCFVENLRRIEERNRMDTAVHGINDFTDLCPEEFRARFLGGYVSKHRSQEEEEQSGRTAKRAQTAFNVSDPALPTIDWRELGAVGPVKTQGHCGSCWTFSAVAAMEGAYNLKYKPTPFQQLSEEYLVQCSQEPPNAGCKGGDMATAINYVISSGGIPSEQSYPYTSGTGVNGTCSTDSSMLQPVAKFSRVLKFYGASEDNLAGYLSTYGPLFIGVAATDAWQTYTGGILSANCDNRELNHGVALVGLGIEDSTYYWIVRNSWGSAWGQSGYIYVQYGSNCNGIANNAGTAVVV